MSLISSSGIAHARLTVTDIERSKAFYEHVFGWPVVVDASDRAGEPGVHDSPEQFYGGTVYQTPSGELFGLRPVAPAGQRFDSAQTGLDHVSFRVEAREDLVTARRRLAAAEIPHGEVIDLPDSGLSILSFSDPDGIHLELTAPLA